MPKMRKNNDIAPEKEPFDDWDSPSSQAMGQDSHEFEDLLKADQVAAVRFHSSRPGYSFSQVEIFVDQVKHTLAVLEQELYEKDLTAHELKREQEELQDRVLELQATIEVFRAKGDPLVNADGSYVRESQLQDTAHYAELEAEMDSLQREIDSLQEENRVLTEKVNSIAEAADIDLIKEEKDIISSERDALIQEIALLKEELEEANAAEEEMRQYVEVTLANWLASQGEDEPVTTGETIKVSEAEEALAEEALEEEALEEEVLLPEMGYEEEEVISPVYSDDEGWGEDAPSIYDFAEDDEETNFLEDEGVSETVEEEQVEEPEESPIVDRTNILVSAPELEGGIDLSSLPMPSGSPIPGLPEPPKRKKAPLTDAPELKG